MSISFLSDCNHLSSSGTNIRVISIMSTSLPNQPVMHYITFIDWYNRRVNISMDWCMNDEVMCSSSYLCTHNSSHLWLYKIFHTFLWYYYAAPRLPSRHRADIVIWSILEEKEYTLYRERPGPHDDPWRIPWQAGEVVSMNALCYKGSSYDGCPYCIRCGRYNSLNDSRNREGEGRIEW